MVLSPANYLKKRRAAAGIGDLDQLRLRLLKLPNSHLTAGDIERAATALERAEMGEADLQEIQVQLLARVIPIVPDVYAQLLLRHYGGAGMPEPKICRRCGCSFGATCETHEGPCVITDGLCSACAHQDAEAA